jgi:hypothetical protein
LQFLTNICAIEFQKIGFPCCHLLIWLQHEFKCHTIEDVDSIIYAGIQDKKKDPICYGIVSQFMIHDPCGMAYPNAQCMKFGSCSKHFPKCFKFETTFDNNGFFYYKCSNYPKNCH